MAIAMSIFALNRKKGSNTVSSPSNPLHLLNKLWSVKNNRDKADEAGFNPYLRMLMKVFMLNILASKL